MTIKDDDYQNLLSFQANLSTCSAKILGSLQALEEELHSNKTIVEAKWSNDAIQLNQNIIQNC